MGVTLYQVRNVVIRDLIVQGFQLDGINAHDSAFDTVLRRVTCRGNARSGISIGGASRLRLENCLVGDNGQSQVRTEGYSHTHIIDCELLDTSAPAVQREGGKIYTESTEPRTAVSSRSAFSISSLISRRLAQ